MAKPRKPGARRFMRAGVLAAVSLVAVGVGAADAQGPILPKRALTPGAYNYTVKQSTIASTICKHGWTATIRPPTSYTTSLKIQQMQQYHETGSPSDYEEDHLIPLELGGAPKAAKNLWPEPHSQSKHSDPLVTSLKRQVCSGTLRLREGRLQIRDYKRAHG
jgi:hypothetical protein